MHFTNHFPFISFSNFVTGLRNWSMKYLFILLVHRNHRLTVHFYSMAKFVCYCFAFALANWLHPQKSSFRKFHRHVILLSDVLALSLIVHRVFYFDIFLRKEYIECILIWLLALIFVLPFAIKDETKINKHIDSSIVQWEFVYVFLVCGVYASKHQFEKETEKIVQFPEVSQCVFVCWQTMTILHCSTIVVCSGCNMHAENIYLVFVVGFVLLVSVSISELLFLRIFVLAIPQWVRKRENERHKYMHKIIRKCVCVCVCWW